MTRYHNRGPPGQAKRTGGEIRDDIMFAERKRPELRQRPALRPELLLQG